MSLKDTLAKKIEANNQEAATASKPDLGTHFPAMPSFQQPAPASKEPDLPSLHGSIMSAGLKQQADPSEVPDNISVSALSMAQSDRRDYQPQQTNF